MSSSIRTFLRDLAADILYSAAITRPSTRNKKHPFYIVTFHRVLPINLLELYPIRGLAVTPGEFTWFVRYFKQHFICGTLSENYSRWVSGNMTNRPLLCITFDDGQLDNYLYARPILEQAGVAATFYIVTNGVENNDTLWYDRLAYSITELYKRKPKELRDQLDKLDLTVMGTETVYEIVSCIVERAKVVDAEVRLEWIQSFENMIGGVVRPDWDGMMNWQQLIKLTQDGHEIGCHSMSHPILPLCNDNDLYREIVLSRKLLQENLDISIPSFCYPNGDFDERTISLVKDAGYSLAVTTRWGQNIHQASPFTLNRFDIQGQTSRSRKGTLSTARLAWRLSPFFPKRR